MEKVSNIVGLDCGSKSFQIEHTKNELEKRKKLLNSVNLAKLPDKGAKLKTQISDLENLLQSLSLDQEITKDNNICDKNEFEKTETQVESLQNLSLDPKITKDNKCDGESTSQKDKNQIQKSKIENVKLADPSARTESEHKSEISVGEDKILFNNANSASFKELASKNITHIIDEGYTKSPSFTGWRDPVRKTKLTEAKPLIEVSSVKKNLQHHFSIKPLLDVNEESVKNIRHSLVTYPDDTLEESDPETLKTSLMMHQRRALSWLMWREQQDPNGGILADDMGLGKTLTMISLILKQKENNNYLVSESQNNVSKGTLIVCLASIIHQWKDEITKHCNHDTLDVMLYHGPKRNKDYLNMMRYDVVLTTYNIVMSEKKAPKNDKVESPLFKIKWERIILDEAHTIKNHTSLTAQAIFSLRAFRKWAVTGTPIHNVFKDIYSLVKFLQFSPFDDYKKFKKLTDDFSESSDTRKKLLIKSIVLRRTKEQADEQGKPLVFMKNKSFSVCYIELSDNERKIYERLNEKATKKFDQYLLKHSKMKSSNLLVLLLRLQQCCSHISLLGKDVDDDDISSDITKTLSSLAIEGTDSNSSSTESSLDLTISEFDAENLSDISVKSSKIKKLFEELNKISVESENIDKSIIVSQWVSLLDIVAYHLTQENIKYHLIAGSTKAEDRQKYMEDFNTKDNVKVMLLSLKAGGVGLNLTGANHMFLLDLHWNPALEMQACDRIHRVGQKKDCNIHKFICKNTIEEKILSLQDSKRSIASSALHGVKQDTKGMTFEDFKILFSVKA